MVVRNHSASEPFTSYWVEKVQINTEAGSRWMVRLQDGFSILSCADLQSDLEKFPAHLQDQVISGDLFKIPNVDFDQVASCHHVIDG